MCVLNRSELIISQIVLSHALAFGIAIGGVIGFTGGPQGLAAVMACLLGGERIKLRLSDKVKTKLVQEPALALTGIFVGYGVTMLGL